MYTLFLGSTIPQTRLLSWKEFKASGRNATIKAYILVLLKNHSKPLSNRQISEMSGIEIGSLTSPLKQLTDENKIRIVGRVKNRTGRIAQTYAFNHTYLIS